MPTIGRISQNLYLGLEAVAIVAFSALVRRSGSAPGSFFTISRVAWRTSSSGRVLLSRGFASRSMSRGISMSSVRSSNSLPAGSPFLSGSPPLSPIVSLRQA